MDRRRGENGGEIDVSEDAIRAGPGTVVLRSMSTLGSWPSRFPASTARPMIGWARLAPVEPFSGRVSTRQRGWRYIACP
jgi:hypothetical protein